MSKLPETNNVCGDKVDGQLWYRKVAGSFLRANLSVQEIRGWINSKDNSESTTS